MKIIKSPSPNYSYSSYGKIGFQIHKTLGTNSLRELTTRGTNVSANILIKRDGVIHELVPLNKRAWSAGRFNRPSVRAKRILLKNIFGQYVKPGHYLVQIEFECLEEETLTGAQYKAAVEWIRSTGISINGLFFLTHKDTAIDKPDMEAERTILLDKLLNETPEPEPEVDTVNSITFESGTELIVKVDGNLVTLIKK